LTLVGYFVFLRNDAVKFLINDEKQKKEAKIAIKQVYKYCDTPEKEEEYYNYIKSKCGKSSSNLNFNDAVCNPQYRGATWVNVGYIIFHELTGINVIMLYSSTMFKQMNKDGGGITPREGTYLVGIVNMLASLVSVGLVKYFGRKTLVVWGHLLIAGIHAATGLLNNQGNSTGVICCVLAFLCVY
jgi:hypothetical protein